MNPFKSIMASITLVKPEEQKAAYASFTMVFLLMTVYFILRPVRDAMASDWTDSELSFLWNIQFFLSTGIVMLYCFVISKIRFIFVVPIIYALFAASFLIFYFITKTNSNQVWIEKGFYVWVTAFSLLNLSVFWSFMSDRFTQDQGRRLFAFIGAGASLGAIVGPSIPAFFAEKLGVDRLMLVACTGLILVIPIIFYLIYFKNNKNCVGSNKVNHAFFMQTQWWSGFRDTLRNPYLIAIAVFILLYVFINSFVYFQQKNLLSSFSRTERAQILGSIDWLVNILTFVFAFVVTSRMLRNFGMGLTLASLPFLVAIGFLILALVPIITVLLALQTARKVGNYSVTRPAREILFTQVSTDERYKAKPVIDVVVYRGGDAVSGSLYAGLTDGMGIGIMGMSIIGVIIAIFWAIVGLLLGKQFSQKSKVKSAQNTHKKTNLNSKTHFKTGEIHDKIQLK